MYYCQRLSVTWDDPSRVYVSIIAHCDNAYVNRSGYETRDNQQEHKRAAKCCGSVREEEEVGER